MRDKQFNAIGCAFLLLIIVFLAAVCFLCLCMERRITALESSRKASGQAEPVKHGEYVATVNITVQRPEDALPITDSLLVHKGLAPMVGQPKVLRSVGDLREARR